jgi:hypothetical protein
MDRVLARNKGRVFILLVFHTYDLGGLWLKNLLTFVFGQNKGIWILFTMNANVVSCFLLLRAHTNLWKYCATNLEIEWVLWDYWKFMWDVFHVIIEVWACKRCVLKQFWLSKSYQGYKNGDICYNLYGVATFIGVHLSKWS